MSKLKSWPISRAQAKLGKYGLLGAVVIFAGLLTRSVQDYRQIVAEPMSSWTTDPSADCGIVLTGGAGRIKEGVALLSRGLIRKLIISGVHPQVTLREIIPQLPFYGHINESDILLEHHSTTTYGNAQQTLPIVEALGCRDAILITSRTHMFRAYRVFRAAYPDQFTLIKHAIPPGRLESFFDLSTEVLKSVFYSMWAY